MMPVDGRRADQPPMFGPGGRIPAVQAVTLTRPSIIRTLRQGWLPRHSVALVLLSPLLFFGYSAASGSALATPLGDVLVGAMAVVAALVLTTYLPLGGATRGGASSCALMGALLVPGAGILVHQATGPLSGGLGLAILGLALWQRLSGASACA
jgi:hypothetical protein